MLALAGGAVAIWSAWLPWINAVGASITPLDQPDMSRLECGYYLLIGGGIAAVCGLLLLLPIGGDSSLPLLLGIGAIAGGVLVVAVDAFEFGSLNDAISLASEDGLDAGIGIGYGLYLGIGAGVAAALGGLIGLSAASSRLARSHPPSPRGLAGRRGGPSVPPGWTR